MLGRFTVISFYLKRIWNGWLFSKANLSHGLKFWGLAWARGWLFCNLVIVVFSPFFACSSIFSLFCVSIFTLYCSHFTSFSLQFRALHYIKSLVVFFIQMAWLLNNLSHPIFFNIKALLRVQVYTICTIWYRISPKRSHGVPPRWSTVHCRGQVSGPKAGSSAYSALIDWSGALTLHLLNGRLHFVTILQCTALGTTRVVTGSWRKVLPPPPESHHWQNSHPAPYIVND